MPGSDIMAKTDMLTFRFFFFFSHTQKRDREEEKRGIEMRDIDLKRGEI